VSDRPLNLGIACFASLGGSGVIATELAVGLARRGHQVHLLASSRPSRVLPHCDRLRFHAVDTPGYPLFQHAPYTLSLATKIVDVSREHGLDLVQVHYAVPHAASALLARQVLGASAPAMITSLHGSDVMKIGSTPAYRSVTSHAVTASDGVTVPSDFLRREARERLGIPDSRDIEVIPNFVDTAHFAPAASRDRGRLAGLFESADDGPVLCHVSNFRAVKRVGDLLDVLARVRRSVPARLLLVGDGPERAAAEARAEELGLSSATCFLGKRHDFVEYLRQADAFVLPSEMESFGVAALEAMSCGVPVVAYRVGGLPELVAEGTGRLVEPFDVEALADAVLEVVTDAALQERMGRAAREHALLRFRKEPALDRYEAYFRGVLAR
jgi:N-acetyl-alpha-D-glucosaminyl L-malate synthase BshA